MFKVSSGTIIKLIQVCQGGRGKRRQGLLLLPIQPDDSVWPYKEVTITFLISLSVSLSPSTIPPKPVRKIITRKVYGSTIRNRAVFVYLLCLLLLLFLLRA